MHQIKNIWRNSGWHFAVIAAIVAVGGFAAIQLRGDGSAAEITHNQVQFDDSDPQPTNAAGTLSMAQGSYAVAPRPLTPSECEMARPRMEGQASLWEKQIKGRPDEKTLASQLTAAVSDSRRWFDVGCPTHPKLGYYEATDGSESIMSVILNFP